jgi:DNA polymerase III subunit delta
MFKADAFEAHLAQAKKNGPEPLYVLTGDEPLLVMELQDQLRAMVIAHGHTEREVMVHEKGFDWSALMNAGQTMSLFGDKRYVELRIPTGKPGRDGADAIKQFCAQIAAQKKAKEPVDTVTCLLLPRVDFQTQKSAWFTALDEAGTAVRIDPIERTHLPGWIAQRLKKQKQQVEAGEPGQRALQFMANQVEGNLIAAHQEIQKLGLLYPEGNLTEENIRDAVLNVARYDVFQLTESLLAGDLARFNRMVDGLQGEGEALVLILWTVTEEVRLLNRLRQAVDRGDNLQMLMKVNRIWGNKERLIPQALQRLNADRLTKALTVVSGLDKQSKGLQIQRGSGPVLEKLPGDPWDGLRMLGRLFV